MASSSTSPWRSEAEAVMARMSQTIVSRVKEAYAGGEDVVVLVKGWDGIGRSAVLQYAAPKVAEALNESRIGRGNDFRVVDVHVSRETQHFLAETIRDAQAAAVGLPSVPEPDSPFWEEEAGRGLKSLYHVVMVHLDDPLQQVRLQDLSSPHGRFRSTILIPALSARLSDSGRRGKIDDQSRVKLQQEIEADLLRRRGKMYDESKEKLVQEIKHNLAHHRGMLELNIATNLLRRPRGNPSVTLANDLPQSEIGEHFSVLSDTAALGLLQLEAQAAATHVLLRRPQGGGRGRLPVVDGDTTLDCFLYCTILHKLDNPVHVWRAEGFLGGRFDHSPESAQLVLSLIAELRDRRMLSTVYRLQEYPLKVCDPLVGRARASFSLWEEQRGRGFLSRHSMGLEDFPEMSVEEWKRKDICRISLGNNKIEKLPTLLRLPECCPNLCTLLINDNPRLDNIPDEVFSPDMPNMRTIDLSGTAIRRLPSSLSRCRNLRMLSLDHCNSLETLSPTVESGLTYLEVLSVVGCPLLGMTTLSLHHMTHLQALCFYEAFHNLEEFNLYVNHGRVFEEYLPQNPSQKSCWAPPVIKRAHISVSPGDDSRKREASSLIPERFPLYTSVHHQIKPLVQTHLRDIGRTCCRKLEIQGGDENVLSYNVATKICQPDFISLYDNQAETCINLNDYTNLSYCRIQRCHQIRIAFSGNFQTTYHLKDLYLSHLRKLRYLFPSNVAGNLPHLTNIHIEYCQNLVTFFPDSTVQLPVLRDLEIRFCPRLQSIFNKEIEEQVDCGSHFPALEQLRLCELPQLTSFRHGNLPSIKKLKVRGCWKLRNLPGITPTRSV